MRNEIRYASPDADRFGYVKLLKETTPGPGGHLNFVEVIVAFWNVARISGHLLGHCVNIRTPRISQSVPMLSARCFVDGYYKNGSKVAESSTSLISQAGMGDDLIEFQTPAHLDSD